MIVCRLPKKVKHHRSHVSANQLWLAIAIVTTACGATADVFLHVPGTAAAERDTRRPNPIDCAALGTCAECAAAAPTCNWLLVTQTCDYTTMATTTAATDALLTEEERNQTSTTAAGQQPASMSAARTEPASTTAAGTQPPSTTAAGTQPPSTTAAGPQSPSTTAAGPQSPSTTAAGPQSPSATAAGTQPPSVTTTGRPDAGQTDPLTVRDPASCPLFAVDYDRAVDTDGTTHAITVNVTNDRTGAFRALLARSQIVCQLNGVPFPGKTAGAGAQIMCVTLANRAEAPSSMSYFSVSANGSRLAFDRPVDHYLTANRHACDTKQAPGQECADCVWDDDAYRYYCRWCPRGNTCFGQYEHCDVRPLNDLSRAAPAVQHVLVQCPAIRVESFEPVYGPWSGGTTVRVVVVNSRMLSERRVIEKVTVAGRSCMVPAVDTKDGAIKCTIPPTNASRMNSGPVEVTYGHWHRTAADEAAPLPAITLRSARKFYFVEPEVTGMRPACGPVAGGTKVTVVGNYLNAGNAVRVYVGDGNATCAVTSHGHNNVTCVTGPAAAPSVARVRLQFDDYLTVYVPHAAFEYTGDPTVDGGQTFRAIVSGGTRLPVRGRYLSCIKNPLIYVTHNGFQHTAGCEVRNATYMECRTPKIGQPVPVEPVAALEFGFQAEYGKNVMQQLQQPPVTSRYLLYPDPVYTDFETDGRRTVTINGQHLDRGYYVRADLQVWLRNSTVPCNVTSVRPDRIVCKTPARPRPLPGANDEPAISAHDELDVTFGNVVYNVRRRVGRHDAHIRLTTVFFSGITIVSLVITLVVAVVYCTKIAMMASSQQTEMQSLCEQLTTNVNAGVNNNNNSNTDGTNNNNNNGSNDDNCNNETETGGNAVTTAAVNGGFKKDEDDKD